MARRSAAYQLLSKFLLLLLSSAVVRGDGLFGSGAQPNISLYIACGSAIFLTATVAYFMFCRRRQKASSTTSKQEEISLESTLKTSTDQESSPREDGEGPRRRPPSATNKLASEAVSSSSASDVISKPVVAATVEDKTKCSKCGGLLSGGGTTLRSNNMNFHKECFVCNSCNQKLEFGRIVNLSGKLNCERCGSSSQLKTPSSQKSPFIRQSSTTTTPTTTATATTTTAASVATTTSTPAPAPKLTILPPTTTTITTSVTSTPAPTTPSTTPAAGTTSSTLAPPSMTSSANSGTTKQQEVISPRNQKKCGKCGLPVGNTAVQALDQEFHEECWVCSVCNKPIEGRFVSRGGNPVCEVCARASQKSGSRIGNTGGSQIGSSGGSRIGSGGGSQIGSSGGGGSRIGGSQTGAQTGQMGLLQWCKNRTEGYEGVEVTNFTKSWADGLAFCALVHSYAPELIDYNSLPKGAALEDKALRLKNCQLAFEAAEKLGVTPLLDAEDVVYATPYPEKLSMMTYLSSLYKGLAKASPS